jgi:hypothetical protein
MPETRFTNDHSFPITERRDRRGTGEGHFPYFRPAHTALGRPARPL